MDGAHVFDFLAAAAKRIAHWRLRRADGAKEALQEAEIAQAEGYGKDRASLGAISQRCLLVHVAELGYQDGLERGSPLTSAEIAVPVIKWLSMADVKIRVLVAKPGLDGHDRGAKVIARALRDAGMEVIYTGLRQTPEMIVTAALQEDVQVIGLSILSGAHNAIVPRVMDLLRQNKMEDVLVLVGGIIPDQDIDGLKKAGVAAIFQPGTAMDEIVQFIRTNVKTPGVATAG